MFSYEKEYADQMEDLIAYSHLIYDRGLVSAAGGNLSVRCKEKMLITGGNVPLRRVDRNGIVLCDLLGARQDGPAGLLPSKETPFHTRVYSLRPEVNFVIHAHPVHAIAYSLRGEKLPMLTESARMKLREVPVIEDGSPGSQELATLVELAVRDAPDARAFLMKAHGALVMGETAEECFCTLELLEDTCRIAFFASL